MSGDRGSRRDLIVLVADADAEQAIAALLRRPKSLGIRPLSFVVHRFPKHDSGCFGDAQEVLRSRQRQFQYALVLFDRHGCGREHKLDREGIEADVEGRLARNGWSGRSVAVVFDPELEVWVWSDSPIVAEVLGWQGRHGDLRGWLERHGNVSSRTGKPADPKSVFHEALRLACVRTSPVLFRRLAERVTLAKCTDPAFVKFRSILQQWFPPGDEA